VLPLCYFLSLQGYYRKGEIECAAEHYKEAIESFKVVSHAAIFKFNCKNTAVFTITVKIRI